MRRREHASGPASSAKALNRPLRGSTLQRKASVISRHGCGVGGAERCLERALSAARPYVISRTVLFPPPSPAPSRDSKPSGPELLKTGQARNISSYVVLHYSGCLGYLLAARRGPWLVDII